MAIETFDYPGGTTSVAGATLLEGDYVVNNKKLTKGSATPSILFDSGRDGSVTVDMHNTGVSFANAFILMRVTDTSNLILFGLAPGEGELGARCRIYLKEGGVNNIVADEYYTALNDPDLTKVSPVYRMTAVCDGTDLKFYVNGELVCSATDVSAISGDGIGLRVDDNDMQFDNYRYTSEIITPPEIVTQSGSALSVTKLGQIFPIHSQILADGYEEEFFLYPVDGSTVPSWPSSTYPVIVYSSPDHGSGPGGIYVRVWNSTLGAITDPAAWEEWQNVSSRPEFDHITTKTCPIYVDDDFVQTETPAVRVIDGVVNMLYHTRSVLVPEYPEGVQNTHLATGTNGIDFTRSATSVITYNPEFEQGDGHTGYAKPIINPLSKYPYEYIAMASHGGGSDGTGGAAIYGANTWDSWEFITLIGSSTDKRIVDHAPAGWEDVEWGARINSLDNIRREGEYWRCVFNLRIDDANGGDTIPYLPVEVLIDDEFNLVSEPNLFIELGANGDFDEGEILQFIEFEYGSSRYGLYKSLPLAANSNSAVGMVEVSDASRDWRLFQTLAEKSGELYLSGDYAGLTANNTTITDADGLINLSVPANGTDAIVTGASVTPSSHGIVELSFKRHGRMTESDIGGMVGFFDDVTNIQNGIGLRWPTNATGDDYIRLVITVGGVETEYVTNEVLSRLAGGSVDYVMSKKSYGFRIDVANRLVHVLDGRAVVYEQDISDIDLTTTYQSALIHYSDTAALGSVAFEQMQVSTFSNDARALRPIAGAGADQSDIVEGDVVTLDGTASAAIAPATIASYQWVQTGGESVTLSDATEVNPTFTAPNIDTEQTLTFSLTVIDSNGLLSDADLVNVDMIVTSTLTATIDSIPDGTYDTRVIDADNGLMPFFGSKEWANGSATFTLNDVQVGTNCEVFALTPNDLPAGAARGVTE